MIRPMQHIVIVAPPIVLTRLPKIDTLVGVLGDSIEATAKDLAAEGVWQS